MHNGAHVWYKGDNAVLVAWENDRVYDYGRGIFSTEVRFMDDLGPIKLPLSPVCYAT